jgi:hypothetical protein
MGGWVRGPRRNEFRGGFAAGLWVGPVVGREFGEGGDSFGGGEVAEGFGPDAGEAAGGFEVVLDVGGRGVRVELDQGQSVDVGDVGEGEVGVQEIAEEGGGVGVRCARLVGVLPGGARRHACIVTRRFRGTRAAVGMGAS